MEPEKPGGSTPAPVISSTPPSEEREHGDFRVGDVIDVNRFSYEVRQILRGGMGMIYICRVRGADETVAIKTFQGRFLENERAKARFTQEAYTWINLEKHPNVVQARKVESIASGHAEKRPHILLEYVAGPEGVGSDLKSWIEHNRLDLTLTLEIAMQICLGMQHATRMVEGLVHRDLKPANILVRHD